MAIRYRKNQKTEFVKPIFLRSNTWIILAFLIPVLTTISYKFIDIPIHYFYLLISISAYILIYFAFSLIRRIYRTHDFHLAIQEILIEKRIKKALIATMTVNQNIGTSFIDVPKVKVFLDKPHTPKVIIERLAGMNKLEEIEPNINVAFNHKYSNFAVTSAFENDNGLDYTLYLEDVNEDKTFCPSSPLDLQVKPYELILQKQLKINLAKNPHLAVIGRSGSGKTSTLFSLIFQLLQTGTDIRFIDGKIEFSSFSEFYPSDKIASDTDSILAMLSNITDELNRRQKIVAEAVSKYRKLGLTGYDINLQPLVVIADELGSLVAGMTTKERNQLFSALSQITQKGRSVSVFLIVGNQFANVDVLPNNIRSQIATKILLGTANSELQRMVFNEANLIKTGDVKAFTGYYTLENKNIQPLSFFVPNLHEHKLNTLDNFEQAYQYGLSNYSHLYLGGYAYSPSVIQTDC